MSALIQGGSLKGAIIKSNVLFGVDQIADCQSIKDIEVSNNILFSSFQKSERWGILKIWGNIIDFATKVINLAKSFPWFVVTIISLPSFLQ